MVPFSLKFPASGDEMHLSGDTREYKVAAVVCVCVCVVWWLEDFAYGTVHGGGGSKQRKKKKGRQNCFQEFSPKFGWCTFC